MKMGRFRKYEPKIVSTFVLLFVFSNILVEICAVVDNIGKSNRRHDVVKRYSRKWKKKEGMIILTHGKTKYEGNVEIFHDGVWGSVCDDEWDVKDASVVCRQLGFHGVRNITHGSFFGPASGQFWTDNLYCAGTEKYLSHCHFEGWGLNDCDMTEAAGVTCDPLAESSATATTSPRASAAIKVQDILKPNIQVRLAGGRVRDEGRIEVKYNNSDWGVICGDGWSILEAMVVCRMLAFGYARSAVQTNLFGGRMSSMAPIGPIHCRGNESHIGHCLVDASLQTDCLNHRNHVAGVVCTTDLPDLEIDAEELEKSSYIEDKQLYSLQCAMEENCLASSAYRIQRERKTNWHLQTRRLLRFTTKITNIGNTDFRPFIPKHLWEFHQCHMHYHSMEIFATFDVLNSMGAKVAEGHKASFCLEDNQCTNTKPNFACANYGDQGISVNCSDIYRHSIDCQWVDISELRPGLYTFKVSINPEFKVAEMTYSNNVVLCSMYYTDTYVRIYDCCNEHP